jgi:hypothetical protein
VRPVISFRMIALSVTVLSILMTAAFFYSGYWYDRSTLFLALIAWTVVVILCSIILIRAHVRGRNG